MTPTHSLSPARLLGLLLLASLAGTACQSTRAGVGAVSDAESRAIADSLEASVRSAYDLGPGDVPSRMLSVYPARGRVVSAAGGRVTTTRDSLAAAIGSFWDGVGQYMINPTWRWGEFEVDVLTRDVAVMSVPYTVPHWTDRGAPHVIGGVWTAVWQRRDGRWVVTHEHLSDLPRAAAIGIEATMRAITPLDSTAAPDSAPRDSSHRH